MFDWLKNIRWKAAGLCGLLLLTAIAINVWMVHSSESRAFPELSNLPTNDVGLLLGTGARKGGGRVNPHFQRRVEAAASLYHTGKIRHLLVSGDNWTEGCDETTQMREALLKLGVPEKAMTLDYSSLRTLDSVVRAKTVFGLTRLTVITEDFHVYRALFLCQAEGIEAVAFPCTTVPSRASSLTLVREWLARVKAWLDVYVLHTEPKFYGPRVEIKIAQPTS